MLLFRVNSSLRGRMEALKTKNRKGTALTITSFFFIWLSTQFSFISMTYGQIFIPVCKNYDGSFPNDSVLCEGYYGKNAVCTNPKECCKSKRLFGCFNMSVLQAYGLWHPPPDNKFPQNDGSCTLKDNFFPQGNNTDKAADGQVIIQHMVITSAHCGDFCLREPQCDAFNLGSLLNREGKKFCELLQHVVRIVDRPGFSFWFFDRVAYKEAFLVPICRHQD
ncbi:uncharacterized protein [Montipora capricornis]|uniref:uncharacterized protein n=1 Tax=Montipora capricornis TaxID=246305 RepID=UPI0035F128B3